MKRFSTKKSFWCCYVAVFLKGYLKEEIDKSFTHSNFEA